MSGRSAYVRKEKTKTKEGPHPVSSHEGRDDRDGVRSPGPTFEDLSRHNSNIIPEDDYYTPQLHQTRAHTSSRSTVSSHSDDHMAYARVRNPPIPIIDVSGIEKSSFRQMMDKKSEDFRKGLSLGFGKKKKRDQLPEPRPTTSHTIRQEAFEVEAPTAFHQPQPLKTKTSMRSDLRDGRPGPPQGQLPPLPPAPQLKRWAGTGRPPQPWNKLRKDPELWDPNGDTLIYLGEESHQNTRQPPSFRISSHVLENTESRFFITMLRDGITDGSFGPASPVIMGGPQRRGGGPPIASPNSQHSDLYSPGAQDMDGQISYELYFPPPANLSMVDSLRHNVTTRNVFALLYQTSLAGFNLYQALQDLSERLQLWMPPECDVSGMIIDYITARGIDDVRNEPSTAVSLLAWSEQRSVRWVEGWREAFIHCTGMLHQLDSVPEMRNVTPITKALLDRASLEVQVRIQAAEDRLADFDFADMFHPSLQIAPSSPERTSFERLRGFLKQYYASCCGTWPPAPVMDDEQWLNRGLVQKLSQDFGALYDYLVDRSVLWDSTGHPSTRQWTLIRSDRRPFTADPPHLPLTSLLVDFDTRHAYPHIPYPYPLLPASAPSPSHPDTPANAKLADRKAALAYAEATNIYRLGADFPANRLVDAFVRFEKSDAPGARDPAAARTGRWILLYGLLQALASIAVDAPAARFTDAVSYHLCPRLRGTPPWKTHGPDPDEPRHESSHCWLAARKWAPPREDVAATTAAAAAAARRPSPYDRDRRQPHNVSTRRAGPSSARSSVTTGTGTARSSVTTTTGTATESEDNTPRSPDFDDVPPLLEGRRRRADGRGSASASGTESDTASSVRSPASARSVPRRRNGGREFGQEHLPPLPPVGSLSLGGYGKEGGYAGYPLGGADVGAGKQGYGRGIERVGEEGDEGASGSSLLDIEWPVRGESRLGRRSPGTVAGGGVVIRDFDEYRF